MVRKVLTVARVCVSEQLALACCVSYIKYILVAVHAKLQLLQGLSKGGKAERIRGNGNRAIPSALGTL